MMYGFKKRFVAPILAGTKIGTIRTPRTGKSRHARPCDGLQLKAGARFHPVVFAVSICTGQYDVTLDMGTRPLVVAHFPDEQLIYNEFAAPDDLAAFAAADGFDDWDDLCRFWRDVHQVSHFTGTWILWGKVTPL